MREAAARRDDSRLLRATSYALWDADKIRGCVCDPGYAGYDCSQRECAVGDDPMTTVRRDRAGRPRSPTPCRRLPLRHAA